MIALARHTPHLDLPAFRAALLETIENKSLDIPMLPAVAAEAMAMISNPDCDARRLAELIHRDASIAAHLLRVASSPHYQRGVRIVSLQQALARLGTRTVGEIVVSICMKTSAFRIRGLEAPVPGARAPARPGPSVLDGNAIFAHSYATAYCARSLARSRRASVEEAFLGGLLHDLGKIALLQAGSPQYLGAGIEERLELDHVIDELHELAGAAIAAAWSLPPAVYEVMRFHHDPDSAPAARRTAHIVAFADALAKEMLEGEGEAGELGWHPSVRALNLYPEDIEALLAERESILEVIEVMP